MAGLNRASALRKTAYFLTLTSAPNMGVKLAHDWDLLVKRIRREMGFEFRYMKVETSEGNGVIHALFYGGFTEEDGFLCEILDIKTGKFKKTEKYYDAIHAYFSCLWKELHNSPNIWCSVVDKTTFWSKKTQRWVTWTKKRVCRYIVQYSVNQKGFLRRASSINWVFRGWRKKMISFITDFGFIDGIKRWTMALRNPDFNPHRKPPIQQSIVI